MSKPGLLGTDRNDSKKINVFHTVTQVFHYGVLERDVEKCLTLRLSSVAPTAPTAALHLMTHHSLLNEELALAGFGRKKAEKCQVSRGDKATMKNHKSSSAPAKLFTLQF